MLYTQVIFAISALKYHDTGSSANCIRAYPRTRFGVEKKLYSNSIIFLYRLYTRLLRITLLTLQNN